jgi:beta-barrel assembly-enhancing protease
MEEGDMRRWGIGLLILLIPLGAWAQRTRLKPGFNIFSPEQDVELGLQNAKEAEKQLPMLNKPQVDDYLNRMGKRLALYAPGEKYPYQFKCVNDASINAFALPGGFLFVNRGTIESADNEAELAGVIGHEIGHAALRHGTNQASKQQIAQAPLALLSGVLGSKSSIASLIAQYGAGFTVNSILLKYSRDDERQADLIGTQILYDAGYDPQYMAKFFEKLETGKRGSDFFNSHPNPDNRIKNIHMEISKLGSLDNNTNVDSSEFQRIKKYLKSLPPAPKAKPESAPSTQNSQGSSNAARPERPSARFTTYDSGYMILRHPDNWKVYGEDRDFMLAPDNGRVRVGGNSSALACGVMMSVAKVDIESSLNAATEQFIAGMRNSNPNLRLTKDRGEIKVGGRKALSRMFFNDSPLGGREIDWIITIKRSNRLIYFIFVAPEEDFTSYQRTFQKILDSVQF